MNKLNISLRILVLILIPHALLCAPKQNRIKLVYKDGKPHFEQKKGSQKILTPITDEEAKQFEAIRSIKVTGFISIESAFVDGKEVLVQSVPFTDKEK